MANIKVEFYSHSLIRPVAFEMFIPNDLRADRPKSPHYSRKRKTIFVLHGYSGWGKGWDHLYSLAEKYNFALVFPSCENSFYLDSEATAGKYGTYVGSELVSYIRDTFGLCLTREETFISGFSMGGFGALHTGLAYSDHFSKIVAVSSALIVREIAGMKPGESNEVANYFYYRQCFGDLENLLQSENNPEVLVEKLLKQGKEMPEIYMACGTEDFLLGTNRCFHSFLTDHHVPVNYIEDCGNHSNEFCNKYFEAGFEWMAANGQLG